jgi:hypothetical protein
MIGKKLNRSLFFILAILFSLISFSQITNTRKWRKTEKDSLDNGLLLYEEKNYILALPIFENVYHHHPKEEFLKYVFGRCALYRSDKYDDAYTTLSEIYARNKKVFNIEYDLARAAHFTNRFDEALNLVNAFLVNKRTKPEDKKDAELLKHYINNAIYFSARPTKAKISNVGDAINTQDDEYVPAITADESMMIFTYEGIKSKGGRRNAFGQPDTNGSYCEDIYESVKVNDVWQKATPLDSINTVSHDAAVSLSHDGTVLFVYRDNGDDHGDLYQSYLIGDVFTHPYKLRGQVNSYAWEGHCSLAPDGRTLYFSSERAGGYGGKDIYKATLQPDSSWGNVVNLGDSINTQYDEDAPFIHSDGITLYFSSRGRSSMGGYDIFQSTLSIGDSIFRVTENMGYPINSPDDDIYFVLSAYGNNGYYSSGKKGGFGLKDIYLIETNMPSQKMLYMVKGKTTSNKNPVETKITIDIASGRNFKTITSNSKTGSYLVTLPVGADYKITYTYKDKPAQTLTLSTKNLTAYTEKIYDVAFDEDTLKTQPTPTVPVTPTVAVNTNTTPAATETFVPNTKEQAKTMAFLEKYGDATAPGLEFRVQIAAYKYPKNYSAKHLKGLGKIDNVLLDDGITRITIGGAFNTLRKAFEHDKKVVNAGQRDAFVTAIYKGKRIYLEQLTSMGILKPKE